MFEYIKAYCYGRVCCHCPAYSYVGHGCYFKTRQPWEWDEAEIARLIGYKEDDDDE